MALLSRLASLGRAVAASSDGGDNNSGGGGRRSLMTPDEARRLSEARRSDLRDRGAGGGGAVEAVGSGSPTSWSQRLRDNKLGAAGIGLWAGLVGYYLMRVRSRKLPLQMYLIQLRVGAQAACIGCITLGCFYAAMNTGAGSTSAPGSEPATKDASAAGSRNSSS